MKSTRADWAATTSWDGIQGKPDSFPSTAPDISQVGGRSFNNGQIPTWNSALRRFVPGSGSGGGVTPTPPAPVVAWKQITFFWDAPTLLPLQSCYEDFDFIGALTSDAVAAGPTSDLAYCQVTACVPEANKVRVFILNGNLTPVDLSNGIWKIVRFPTV